MRVSIVAVSAEHDAAICRIIQQGGREFGAIGEGFGPSDAEVMAMSQHYRGEAQGYWVALMDNEVVGGVGIADFDAATHTCELRKLFVAPQWRGRGIGLALTEHALAFARQHYRQCYLDTLSNMPAAIGLYQRLGFECLAEPFAATIHGGCDVWMLKQFSQ